MGCVYGMYKIDLLKVLILIRLIALKHYFVSIWMQLPYYYKEMFAMLLFFRCLILKFIYCKHGEITYFFTWKGTKSSLQSSSKIIIRERENALCERVAYEISAQFLNSKRFMKKSLINSYFKNMTISIFVWILHQKKYFCQNCKFMRKIMKISKQIR